jgi:hypothetical protein
MGMRLPRAFQKQGPTFPSQNLKLLNPGPARNVDIEATSTRGKLVLKRRCRIYPLQSKITGGFALL